MSGVLGCAAVLSIILAACAPRSTVPMHIPRLEAMPVRQTENRISVGLDPIITRERQKHVFGDDLLDQGVLPIQVFVKNEGDQPIRVHASAAASLVLADGTEISHKLPVSPPGLRPQRSQFCENALIFGGAMPGPGLLVNLGCGIFGAATGAKYETERTRWQDYVSKQLKSVTLEHDQWDYGFLFFEIPAEKRHISKATLLLRLTEGDQPEGSEETLRLHLSDLKLQ